MINLRQRCGRFEGTLVTTWELSRVVFDVLTVVQPFAFVDCRGRRWDVAASEKTDGASFPWWLNFVPLLYLAVRLVVMDGDHPVRALVTAIALMAVIGAPLHQAYIEAATAHDVPGYRCAERCSLWSAIVSKRRWECDRMFFEAIVTRAFIWYDVDTAGVFWPRSAAAAMVMSPRVMLGYRIARALVMYAGVRAGGWIPYFKHGRRNALEAQAAR